MNKGKVLKVTISIPQRLLEYADRLAKEQKTTRSAVICKLLEHQEAEEVNALMAEGYKEMAEENQRLAEEVFPLISETLLKNTRWDAEVDGQER